MQYVRPPGAGNASGFIDILHATLRGAGCRWNAPEWLATGSGADMAAYTASLTAHAPFVRSATQKQNAYKKAFTQVLWEAIEYAIDYGRLPMDTPHLIDIQCEAPSILARDERDEAQANQIRVTGGWKSRQTVQQEEGLDPEQEMQNIEAYNERFGQGGSGAQGGKPGLVTVQEYNFDPSQPRDRFGKWRKSVVANGLNLHPSSLHPPNNYVAYGYSSAALGDDTNPESPSLPPPGGVVDPAVIARCRREAERIAAEDEERVARGKEPKNDFVREILATNPNISSDDLKRELFGMLLEEDARKRHAHRLKNDPAYVQGIKDAQASQRKAERQLAIQKMSGAERLVEAIERSISSGNLSSEMREQVKEMIAALKEPKNQAILGGALAAVGIAQFTPAGPVVDSIVGIIGYILAGKAVLEAAPDLARFVTAALEAKDDSDFDQAGQYFARGISPLLVQAGTTLVGMGVAKATSAGAKLVGKRIAALKVSKKPITSEGGKLRVDPAIIADAEAEGATAATGKLKDADALKPAKGVEGPKESVPGVEPKAPPTKGEWERPKGWRLPTNGTWEGTPGNSNFIPHNPSELGLKPGETVPFHEGRPDFSKWSKGNFISKEPLTGIHVDDAPIMIKTIADEKGWTQRQVRDWLKEEHLSLHHAGGNEIQLIPRKLHGDPSAIPPIQGIRHMGAAYDLRNPK